MKRTVISIDDEKCDGCGVCIPNCHEGALQLIDGKARLISDLMCDGLGACIGHCPQEAITLEEREAQPYDEKLVMEGMVKKGRNTILAHLQHLRDHDQKQYLQEAIEYIRQNNIDLSPGGELDQKYSVTASEIPASHVRKHAMGCPGMAMADSRKDKPIEAEHSGANPEPSSSELRQWPVQLHLLNPAAPYFINADVVLAADCVAFAYGDFHRRYLRGKTLAIACPKLDQNQQVYIDKLVAMINEAGINTLTVVIMEVPCCGGLQQMAQTAILRSNRRIPLKLAVISTRGQIIREEWV